MALQKSPVWFITGCSTGFGRELALQVLARGWRAVITARDRTRVADLVQRVPGHALAVDLDVTDAAQISAAVQSAEKHFGGIDVLVNNAGYGYQASAEEGEDTEIRAQFEANVFGLFAMTRAVLPGMRSQRSGHLLNVTSVAGLVGFPGSGTTRRPSTQSKAGRARWRQKSSRSASRSPASSRGLFVPTGRVVHCVRPPAESRITPKQRGRVSTAPPKAAASSRAIRCVRHRR